MDETQQQQPSLASLAEPIRQHHHKRQRAGLYSEGRAYQITKVQDNHQEILRRLTLGQKAKDIAADLGVTPAVVSYVRHGAEGKEELRLMQGAANQDTVTVRQRIHIASLSAIAVMEGMLEDEDVPLSLRLRAAQDILDRAGHAAPKVIQAHNTHAVLSREDIEDIKQRARSMGCVVDVEATIMGEEE